jgi:hypothetical protein
MHARTLEIGCILFYAPCIDVYACKQELWHTVYAVYIYMYEEMAVSCLLVQLYCNWGCKFNLACMLEPFHKLGHILVVCVKGSKFLVLCDGRSRTCVRVCLHVCICVLRNVGILL